MEYTISPTSRHTRPYFEAKKLGPFMYYTDREGRVPINVIKDIILSMKLPDKDIALAFLSIELDGINLFGDYSWVDIKRACEIVVYRGKMIKKIMDKVAYVKARYPICATELGDDELLWTELYDYMIELEL